MAKEGEKDQDQDTTPLRANNAAVAMKLATSLVTVLKVLELGDREHPEEEPKEGKATMEELPSFGRGPARWE